MYNTDLPTRAELPTHKQLLKATLGAALLACTLLITVVLPAEHGLDPTGVGHLLGLTEMGEIKHALAHEEKQDKKTETPQLTKQEPASAPQTAPTSTSTSSETRQVTLQPGAATELLSLIHI